MIHPKDVVFFASPLETSQVERIRAAVGDRVELFGTHRPIDAAATAAGTISYELLTAVTARVPRAYVGQ